MAQTKVLRIREVMERTSLARPTIYLFVSQKRFPAPFPLAPRGLRYACGWLESEVTAWINEQAAARPAQLGGEPISATV